MADLTNPRLIYAKGFLFLPTGLLAATLVVLEHPSWKVALLLAVAIWCFARAYMVRASPRRKTFTVPA